MEYYFTGHAINRLAQRALLTKPDGSLDTGLAREIFTKEIRGHSLINNMRRCNYDETKLKRRNLYRSHVETPRYCFEIAISFNSVSSTKSIVANIITAYNLGIKNERTGIYEQTEYLSDVEALESLEMKEENNA